jgi:starch phosphorylase
MRNTEPAEYIPRELQEVFSQIEKGRFGNNQELVHLINSVRHKNDTYLLGQDFKSYIEAQEKVHFPDMHLLGRCHLLKQTGMGKKSHLELAQIWQIQQ